MTSHSRADQGPRFFQRLRNLSRWAQLGLGLGILAALTLLVGGFFYFVRTPSAGTTKTSRVDGMQQVYVPEGQFPMGSSSSDRLPDERPQHAVYLDAYWIDKTEVTHAMYRAFVEDTGYETRAEKEGQSYLFKEGDWLQIQGVNWRHPTGPKDQGPAGDKPVSHVSWLDAAAYCQWAGRRLPTEAEWEKAARGSDGQLYPWDGGPLNSSHANFADQRLKAKWADPEMDDGFRWAAPVGSYPAGASPYGALDMAGNVYEWVQDWYLWNYYELSPYRNPPGPREGEHRSVRGGSWVTRGKNYHASSRVSLPPHFSLQDTGFRCVEPVGNEPSPAREELGEISGGL